MWCWVCSAGEAGALYTEDVPPQPDPIFAATATHSVVLPGDVPPSPAAMGMAAPGDDNQPHLSFEVCAQAPAQTWLKCKKSMQGLSAFFYTYEWHGNIPWPESAVPCWFPRPCRCGTAGWGVLTHV